MKGEGDLHLYGLDKPEILNDIEHGEYIYQITLHLDHKLTHYEQKSSRGLPLLSVMTSIGDCAPEKRTKLEGSRELTPPPPPPLRRRRGCVVALLWCTSRMIKMKSPYARSQRRRSQRRRREKKSRPREGLMGTPPVMSLRPTLWTGPPPTPPIYTIQRERRPKRAFLEFISRPPAIWRLHRRSERIHHRVAGRKRTPHHHQPVRDFRGCRAHHRECSCYPREGKRQAIQLSNPSQSHSSHSTSVNCEIRSGVASNPLTIVETNEVPKGTGDGA